MNKYIYLNNHYLSFFCFLTFAEVPPESFVLDGHASIDSFFEPFGVDIATIATDKLTRNMYKQIKPKKAHIATTKN